MTLTGYMAKKLFPHIECVYRDCNKVLISAEDYDEDDEND